MAERQGVVFGKFRRIGNISDLPGVYPSSSDVAAPIWILETGIWDDSGVWVDSAVWND